MARKRAKEYCVHVGSASVHPMSTACFKSKSAAQRFAREARRDGMPVRAQALGALPSWWPFKKKSAPRHPMSRTVYVMKTKSGSYVPVDRPPNATMAGARRRRKRRR
jgi:hypothetical protein